MTYTVLSATLNSTIPYHSWRNLTPKKINKNVPRLLQAVVTLYLGNCKTVTFQLYSTTVSIKQLILSRHKYRWIWPGIGILQISSLVNGSGYVFAYRILVTGLKNYIGVSGRRVTRNWGTPDAGAPSLGKGAWWPHRNTVLTVCVTKFGRARSNHIRVSS